MSSVIPDIPVGTLRSAPTDTRMLPESVALFCAGALPGSFTAEQIEALEARINGLAISGHLGVHTSIAPSGIATARIATIHPFHKGGHVDGEALNGAVITSLLYSAIIAPALAHAGGVAVSTLQLDVKISRPIDCRDVRAIGFATSCTKRFVFANAAVFDWRNEPKVVASGIVVRHTRSRDNDG